MDYYERKSKSLGIIDRLIERGCFTRDDIILAVLKNTQIGKKFVNDYIDAGLLRDAYLIQPTTNFVVIKK